MGVGQFFADRARGFQKGFTQDVRAREQGIEQNKQAMILRGHNAAMEAASQYGTPGSPQWAQAYSTYAAQAGVPQPYIDQAVKLSVDPITKQAARARLKQPKAELDYLRSREEAYRADRDYTNSLMNSNGAPANGGGLSPSGPPAGSGPAPSGAPSGANPGSFFGTTRRVGQSIQDTNRTLLNQSQGPNAAAPQPVPQMAPQEQPQTMAGAMSAGAYPTPAAAFFADPNTDAMTGKPIPETIVRAGQAPTSMKDMGIADTDQAEQFQTLESMVGKGLPEDFDLRADYGRDPEFYKMLFKAIRDGVPDEKGNGTRRKLSTQEIIDLIVGG